MEEARRESIQEVLNNVSTEIRYLTGCSRVLITIEVDEFGISSYVGEKGETGPQDAVRMATELLRNLKEIEK